MRSPLFQRAIQANVARRSESRRKSCTSGRSAIAYDAQLPVAVELGRQWVAAYPSPDSWRNAIAIYRNMNKPDVEGTLDLAAADARRPAP